MSILRAVVFAVALLLCTSPSQAYGQEVGPAVAPSRNSLLPFGARIVDLSVRTFDKSDGLRSPTVYAVSVDLSGRLWIGTEDGPMRYDGDRWQPEELPAAATSPQTRGILQSSDSTYWFATRSGVVRRRGNTQRLFGVADGLPSAVVYSIIETRALTGAPLIVVGTGGGVASFDGERFRTVTMPDSLEPEGLMLGESRAPDGSLELWLASSAGKVGRYAKGQWSVFGAAQGFLSRSAESIVATVGDPSTRVLVPGEAGVFAFRDDGKRGPRFELVPGSPRLAYRVQEVMRLDGARELWVGTLSGRILRRTEARWDTVSVATQQGGRVTALVAVPGHAGGMGVYVGTYGGRLARVGVSSVGTLEGAVVRRDVMLSILPETAADGRTTLWMGTGNAGLVHLDASGRMLEQSRQSGEDFTAVLGLSLLWSAPQPTLRTEPDGGPRDLWIATDVGPYRREGTRLVKHARGLRSTSVRAFVRGPLPDGTTNLLAATDDGVFRWRGDKWEHVPELGNASVRSMTVARDSGGSTLWLGLASGVASATTRGVVFDTGAPTAAQRARAGNARPLRLQQQYIATLCSDRIAQSARVFAGSWAGGVWWRDANTPWRPLPAALQSRWGVNIRALHCLGDGRVLMAVEHGMMVIDARDANPAQWSIQSVAAQEDGLPATEVLAFAQQPMHGIMWMATSRGAGALQLDRIAPPPLAQLTIDLRSEGRTLDWNDAVPLRAGRSDLTIRPALLTYHREEDTRYRVHLHRNGESTPALDSLHAGTSDDSSSWTDKPEAQYRALSAGDYVLRVWARDYAGRVIELPTVNFRVVPPVWRTWWAIVLYAMFIAAAVYVAHRWRLHTLERTNAALATSERHMRASERKFRALFDEASDGHLLIDGPDFTSVNAPARLLLGLDEPGTAGASGSHELRGWRTRLAPVVVREIDELARHGELREYNFKRPDGSFIPISAQITSVALDDRTLWHLVLHDLRTIREAEEVRLRLEDQVRDAQKFESLGTLAGGVAHDFNNLLGVIRGNVELALDTLDDRDAVATHLGTVYDASERARDLVRQILTFSRRSSSREESVDLARLVRELQPMLRSMIPTSVDIVSEITNETVLVRGDSTQLQQVLLNLSSNAEYSMRAKGGGQLHIRLDMRTDATIKSPSGRVARLRVSDTGVGMPADVVERVFEPFFTTKPTGEGTGLGMAVLHGIVASHGGRVLVSSDVGIGTTFEILLPTAIEAAPGAPRVTTAARTSAAVPGAHLPTDASNAANGAFGAAGVSIVLVDDEPGVARVSEAALTRLGYRVMTFVDPVAALAYVRKDPSAVDLVITDQTMPGLTGDVLALELHQLRPELPVIISTGFSYVLTPDRLAEVGSPTVLQKPVSLAVLRSAVDGALRKMT